MQNTFDLIIIGGGASGLGCAIEAASRGYNTLVVEGHDYGKGSSSKSTKLIHGGMRYLANFDFPLVAEGLEERFYLLQNAPHLAKIQSYLIPCHNFLEKFKFWCGIKIYDKLARNLGVGNGKCLTQQETLNLAPDLNHKLIRGGALYYDGQFDDSRLLITLLKTFEHLGGTALNYHQVSEFIFSANQLSGIKVMDRLNHGIKSFFAPIIINATGTFSDITQKLATPNTNNPTVALAQGTHLVFDQDLFNSPHALLLPRTADKRVLFILPWHNKIVVGTTDLKVSQAELEPQATQEEINFILNTFNAYSKNKATYLDIKAIFCGQRPLVKPKRMQNSAKISRKHEIFLSSTGLITVVGGKWTIYRRMGQDTINFMEQHFNLSPTKSITKNLALYGYTNAAPPYPFSVYGTEAAIIHQIQHQMRNFALLHPQLPYFQAEVIYHLRYEQARTVEDILARRTRALFLDSKAAVEAAPVVASIMAQELGHNSSWQQEQLRQFKICAAKFLP